MKKILAAIAVMMMMVVGLSGSALAKDPICNDSNISSDLQEAAGCHEDTTIGGAANGIIDVVLGMTSVIAVGAMIYGGFTFATSAGDPAKLKRGRDVLIYGLVGLVVSLLAFAIVTFISTNV